MDDFTEQFKNLLNSSLGKELVRTLTEDLHDTIVESAEKETRQEVAFGELKKAAGVKEALNHLQGRAQNIVTRDEGRKK